MTMITESSAISSCTVPAIAALGVDDALAEPERTGICSVDNLLGATTPSDESTANSPVMLSAAAAKASDAVTENFQLEANAVPRAPVSLLPLAKGEDDDDEDEGEDDDDDDDGFIPRGGTTYTTMSSTKLSPQPKAVGKPPTASSTKPSPQPKDAGKDPKPAASTGQK